MNKKHAKFVIAMSCSFLLLSCVKKAKDLIDDINQQAQCAELLSEFTTEGGNQSCSQQIEDIDEILRDCGEFLTQDQKDELNLAKENCSDN